MKAWRKPPALQQGDTVVVCAPSGVYDETLLAQGVAALTALGLRIDKSALRNERHLFTAGTIASRGAELQRAFGGVAGAKAVVAARGGAGAGSLMRHLDPRLFEPPRILLGCSDLTWLHLALNRAGIVSLYGPMVAGDLAKDRWHRDSLQHALFGSGEPYRSDSGDLLGLRPGSATGRLLGGCLAILAAACGTPWALKPDPAGTILLLEDVNEPPYRIDRMLLQLREAGAFEGVRGVVFGQMPGCQAAPDAGYTLEDVIEDSLSWFAGPVAVGLATGHTTSAALTLPLGCAARLYCEASGRASFAVTEAAVTLTLKDAAP